MPRRAIDKIRDAIRTGNYDMTFHAVEEMAEDKLGIFDMEGAVQCTQSLKQEGKRNV